MPSPQLLTQSAISLPWDSSLVITTRVSSSTPSRRRPSMKAATVRSISATVAILRDG